MRAVVQRVSNARVQVDGKTVGEIGRGLLVLLAVHEEDTNEDLDYIYNKVIGLRIFEDEDEKMNLSLDDVDGELLVVSQFTLYGDARKGRRPSFSHSASFEKGKEYYEKFLQMAKDNGYRCEGGEFGATMDVELTNHGPVTILLESSRLF